jgi:hypothetical protein
MISRPRRCAILSIAISMLAIGLECASAEECDYNTCGALMARDGSVSWAVSGRRDYSPDTKRACAELNACVRRAKNNSAGRAAAAPAPGLSSLKSSPKGSATDSVAQTAPDAGGGGKFRATCSEDAKRFCVGVQAGGGLVQCLRSHTGELSASCGNMIADTGASNPSAQSPATQTAAPVTVGNSPATIGSALRASCGPDVQRLCAGARRESEVLKCLDSQRMKLSTTCSFYFQNLGTRPSAQESAPNKKPPSPAQTGPIPARENAPSKKPPSPPPSAPVLAPENAPNKEPPSPPPTTPIPD